MPLIFRFWSRAAVWTGILLITLTGVSLAFGQNARDVFGNLPVWAGLALVLSAFPAGLSVAEVVLPPHGPVMRTTLSFTAGAVLLCLLTLVLASYAGPAAARRLSPDRAIPNAAPEPTEMTLPQLGRAMRTAVQRAETAGHSPTVADWLPANRLSWHYYSRLDGSLLPLLFGWIGVLVGFWSRLSPRADARQAQHWAIGMFLVMATYLAGENSYELVVLRAAGPVEFAADFRLLVPAVLVMGLAWPTFLTIWRRSREGSGA